MSFSMDDVMEIIKIVKECKDTELHIDTGDIKLSVFKGDVGDSNRSLLNFSSAAAQGRESEFQAAPAATAPEITKPQDTCVAPPVKATPEPVSEEGLVPVKANVTSVFYRRPSPSEPPYVEVGDTVQEDTVLCLLEVMKCFRQVTAEIQGVVEKICVESNSLVEQGSTLFLIRPE